MKKSIAILSFICGLGVFIAALFAVQPIPVLRQTEDPAIIAEYTAPFVQASTIGHRIRTGKAHVAREAGVRREAMRTVDESETAQTSANQAGLVFGQFSTAAAMNYHTVGYHARVPNLQYIAGDPNHAKH